MTDKTLKILLGIIAVNLTIQTVKDVGLFPTAHAQLMRASQVRYANEGMIQRVEICGFPQNRRLVMQDLYCAGVEDRIGGTTGKNALQISVTQ